MRANVIPIIVHKSCTLEDVERIENKKQNSICKRFIFEAIKKHEINNKSYIVVITSNELYFLKQLRRKNRKK